MSGQLAAIYRHPLKGFTPEPLEHVDLAPGRGFPFDRVFAVENGPSGFDPAAPAFVPKQRFTVLAHLARVAAVRTHFDESTRVLFASAPGMAPFAGGLTDEPGRQAFAGWLSAVLGSDAPGPLKVLEAPSAHRFTDHPQGQVSIVSLSSVADLARRLDRKVDPLRFRANLYVEGWPAWAENDWVGRRLTLGGAEAEVFKPIVRCAATHVNPSSAERDLEITQALFDHFGHMHCGVYVRVTGAGRASLGDACTEAAP